MEDKKLDVIVPCKDERVEDVLGVIDSLLSLSFINRILFVDDGSRTTYPLVSSGRLLVLRNERSVGKTQSVLRAVEYVQTEFCILQDADLEYPVCGLKNLFPLVGEGRMVVARRFVPIDRQTLSGYIANTIIRLLTKEPDPFSGQRIVPTWLLRRVSSKGNFTLETALTLLARRENIQIIYVDSLYYPRTYKEGKKAKPWHMIPILLEIVKFRWRSKNEGKLADDELSTELQQRAGKTGGELDRRF